MPRLILSLVLMLCSTTSFAQIFTIQIGENSGRFHYTSNPVGKVLGPLELNGGLMFNDDDDYSINFGAHVRGENLDAPLLVAVGVRGYYTRARSSDAFSIAIGADVNWMPLSVPGLEVGGYVYGAPDILSFGDGERLLDYGARVGYQIIPLATIFLGYQNFDVDIESKGRATLDDGFMLGVHFRF